MKSVLRCRGGARWPVRENWKKTKRRYSRERVHNKISQFLLFTGRAGIWGVFLSFSWRSASLLFLWTAGLYIPRGLGPCGRRAGSCPRTAANNLAYMRTHWLKVLLWRKSRYPHFYTFVNNGSFLDILPDFNLIRTLDLARVFGPLFPRIYSRQCHFLKDAARVEIVITIYEESCMNLWVQKWKDSKPRGAFTF